MIIEHLAIWATDPEQLKAFYVQYFGGTAGNKYYNPTKKFTSYFISFSDGCRLELMHKPDITAQESPALAELTGLAHFAMSVGSKEAVDALTQRLAIDGYTIAGLPRITGDGYYESIVLDPEGNRIEITI